MEEIMELGDPIFKQGDSIPEIIRGVTFVNRNQYNITKLLYPSQYVALGHHDGVYISKNILLRDPSGTQGKNDDNFSLKDTLRISQMRYHDFNMNHELRVCHDSKEHSKITFETVYLFRSDKDQINGSTTDKEFWQDSVIDDENKVDEFPFLFVSFLQTDCLYRKISWLRIEVERKVQGMINSESKYKGNVKAIVYTTTDASEIVMIVRSKNYNQGVEVIGYISYPGCLIKCKEQHKENECRLTTGYTVPALLNQMISCERQRDNEGIYKAMISMIENSEIDIQIRISADRRMPVLEEHLKNTLKPNLTTCSNEFSVKLVLGNDDYLFQIRNVKWKDMLTYLMEVNGTSTHNSSKYHGIRYMETFLLPEAPPSDCGEDLIISCEACKNTDGSAMASCEDSRTSNAPNKSYVKYCQKTRDEFIKRSKQLEDARVEFDSETGVRISLYQALIQMFNSLLKYESLNGAKYEFAVVAQPLIALVNQIRRSSALSNANPRDKARAERERKNNLEHQRRMLAFLRDASSTIQNSVRSHRQFFSNHDIQIAINDIKPKMLSMYKAFLSKVVGFLNEIGNEVNDFDYLFYPSVSRTNATELILDTERKSHISTIRIDTRHTADTRNLFVILVHEISHACGGELRKRDARFGYAKEAIVTITCLRQYEEFKKLLKKHEKSEDTGGLVELLSSWDNRKTVLRLITEELFKYVKYEHEHIWGERKNKDEQNLLEKMKYYGKYAQEDLGDAVCRVHFQMPHMIELIYNSICLLVRSQQNIEMTKRVRLLQLMDSLKKSLINDQSIFIQGSSTVRSDVKRFFSVLSEVYSDISAILTLELSPKQYFRTQAHDYYSQGYEEKTMPKQTMIRFFLVMNCMCAKPKAGDKHNGYSWSGKWESLCKEETDKMSSLMSDMPLLETNDWEMYKLFIKMIFNLGMLWDLAQRNDYTEMVGLMGEEYGVFFLPEVIKRVVDYIGDVREYFYSQLNETTHEGELSIRANELKKQHEEIVNYYKYFYNISNIDTFIDMIYELNYDLNKVVDKAFKKAVDDAVEAAAEE